MRFWGLFAVGAILSPQVLLQQAAAETVRAEICAKGADIRRIEVIAPGTVGLACDVVYSRDAGANVAVPYNANTDGAFCRARAAELAATLIADGFECSTPASDDIEAELVGGSSDRPIVAAAPSDDAPLNVQLADLEKAELETTGDETPAADPVDAAPSAYPQEFASAPALPDPEAASSLAEIPPAATPLSAPPPATSVATPVAATPVAATPVAATPVAIAGPVDLASGARKSEFDAPRPPATTGAGRLVAPPPSIDDLIVVAEEKKPAVQPLAASTGPASKDKGLERRGAADVIRGVLAANAAAWNEGNFDAFMSGYSTGEDLVFVRDNAVATGWNNVRAAWRPDFGVTGASRLSFSDIDVAMTSNDAASVTGRYLIERDTANETGAVSLSLKQLNGRWRIVEDKRVSDLPLKP